MYIVAFIIHLYYTYTCINQYPQQQLIAKQRQHDLTPSMAKYFNQQPEGSKNRIENVAVVGVRRISHNE